MNFPLYTIVASDDAADLDWSVKSAPVQAEFDADAIVENARGLLDAHAAIFNSANTCSNTDPSGSKAAPALNTIHEILAEAIDAGATPIVRDVIVAEIIDRYGERFGGKQALKSTWKEIADELKAEQLAAMRPRQGSQEQELTIDEKRARRDELWPLVRDLAEDPDLLSRVVRQVHDLGVVGEESVIRLVYIAGTSRLMRNPINPLIKGASSGGKSWTSGQTLQLFPPEDIKHFTTSSPLALVYDVEPLAHKIVSVFEATPLQRDDDGTFALLLRTLISEGKIVHQTTVDDPDAPAGRRSKTIEREGPICLVITTTAESLHAENETRMVSYRVTETPEQTKAIIRHHARQAMGGADDDGVELSQWHDFQRWLAYSPTRVAIPFAGAVADLVPATMVRFRRDFLSFLTFIRAVTLIHQAQRETNELGEFVATLADYAVAEGIFSTVMAQAAGRSASPNVRAVVEHVAGLIHEQEEAGKTTTSPSPPKGSSSRIKRYIGASSPAAGADVAVPSRRLGEQLGLDHKAAQRAVNSAIDQGYLVNNETRRGRPYRLALGDRKLSDTDPILPTAAQVAERMEAGDGD